MRWTEEYPSETRKDRILTFSSFIFSSQISDLPPSHLNLFPPFTLEGWRSFIPKSSLIPPEWSHQRAWMESDTIFESFPTWVEAGGGSVALSQLLHLPSALFNLPDGVTWWVFSSEFQMKTVDPPHPPEGCSSLLLNLFFLSFSTHPPPPLPPLCVFED